MKKGISVKVVKNILFWIATVCLILITLLIVISRLSGVEFRAVLTGSMEPELPVGSLVVIVPTDAEDIKIGDNISFVTEGDMVVTHRVITVNLEADEFTTWGIANNPSGIDEPNRYENIIGVVRLNIPYAGQILRWLGTLQGKIIFATAIAAVYLLSYLLGVRAKNKKGQAAVLVQGNQTGGLSNVTRAGVLIKSFAESEEMFKETLGDNNFVMMGTDGRSGHSAGPSETTTPDSESELPEKGENA